SPSVVIDQMDVVDAEYGVWRPVYKDHVYRRIRMVGVPENLQYAFVTPAGPPNRDGDFAAPVRPVADLPSLTASPHVLPGPGGKVIVRGTTADNGTVKQVQINGRPARALTANYLEWEVVLDQLPANDGRLTAHAEDEAGNVEQLKHTRAIRY